MVVQQKVTGMETCYNCCRNMKVTDLLTKGLAVLLLGLCGILAEEMSMAYKYLDNPTYGVASDRDSTNVNRQEVGGELNRGFPKPPLFPPPPPSIATNTNALLREAIFNNMKGITLKGDNGFEGSITDRPGEGSGGDPDWSEIAQKYCPNFLIDPLPVGPKGTRGSKGPRGPRGVKGRRGKKGKSGPLGPPGPAGVKGSVGPPGMPGGQGVPGLMGRDGPKGDRGYMGPRGYPGRSGPTGSSGLQGDKGPKGSNGIPGLVVFPDASAMFGVELEGLIAYRSDVKLLYFRDNVTWRPIRITRCGDGIVDRDVGEECDDGNDDNNDGCVDCRIARCGDGFMLRGKEQCDGQDFGTKPLHCAAWRKGTTGTLVCSHRCEISYRRCRYEFR